MKFAKRTQFYRGESMAGHFDRLTRWPAIRKPDFAQTGFWSITA
jgi:hypothetical protein